MSPCSHTSSPPNRDYAYVSNLFTKLCKYSMLSKENDLNLRINIGSLSTKTTQLMMLAMCMYWSRTCFTKMVFFFFCLPAKRVVHDHPVLLILELIIYDIISSLIYSNPSCKLLVNPKCFSARSTTTSNNRNTISLIVEARILLEVKIHTWRFVWCSCEEERKKTLTRFHLS